MVMHVAGNITVVICMRVCHLFSVLSVVLNCVAIAVCLENENILSCGCNGDVNSRKQLNL